MNRVFRWLAAAALPLGSPYVVLGQVDVTGDGRIEVVFGDAGLSSLEVLDGATGQLLWQVSDNNMFGWAATAHPDIDGDGRVDVLATAPGIGTQVAGHITALRGFDGAVLWTTTYGGPADRFGIGVGIIPDQDSDKVHDLLVGTLSGDPSGETVVLVSGKTGQILATTSGPLAVVLRVARTGELVFKPKDLDGSGVIDVNDAAMITAANGSGDPAADIDFSGVVDYEDVLKLMDTILFPDMTQLHPGQYCLLSLEDPFRYNDGYQVVAATSPPFQPTPATEPCAAERDVARLAALEWARHMQSLPGSWNPFDLQTWSDWNAWRPASGYAQRQVSCGISGVQRMSCGTGSTSSYSA